MQCWEKPSEAPNRRNHWVPGQAKLRRSIKPTQCEVYNQESARGTSEHSVQRIPWVKEEGRYATDRVRRGDIWARVQNQAFQLRRGVGSISWHGLQRMGRAVCRELHGVQCPFSQRQDEWCVLESTVWKAMIRRKQTKAKSVPDNEVTATFWGEEDVQTERGSARQMQKYQRVIYNLAGAAILRICCPPDRDCTCTVPEATSAGHFTVTSFHPVQPWETKRRGNVRARKRACPAQGRTTSKRQRWELDTNPTRLPAGDPSTFPLAHFNLLDPEDMSKTRPLFCSTQTSGYWARPGSQITPTSHREGSGCPTLWLGFVPKNLPFCLARHPASWSPVDSSSCEAVRPASSPGLLWSGLEQPLQTLRELSPFVGPHHILPTTSKLSSVTNTF